MPIAQGRGRRVRDEIRVWTERRHAAEATRNSPPDKLSEKSLRTIQEARYPPTGVGKFGSDLSSTARLSVCAARPSFVGPQAGGGTWPERVGKCLKY